MAIAARRPPPFQPTLGLVARSLEIPDDQARLIWATDNEYAAALASYIANTVEYANTDLLVDAVTPHLDDGLFAVVENLGYAYLAHLYQSPEFMHSLNYAFLVNDLPEEIRRDRRAAYETIQRIFEEFFTGVTGLFGYTASSERGWDFGELTTVATALTEGMAMRLALADSEEEVERLLSIFTKTLTTLLSATTDRA